MWLNIVTSLLGAALILCLGQLVVLRSRKKGRTRFGTIVGRGLQLVGVVSAAANVTELVVG